MQPYFSRVGNGAALNGRRLIRPENPQMQFCNKQYIEAEPHGLMSCMQTQAQRTSQRSGGNQVSLLSGEAQNKTPSTYPILFIKTSPYPCLCKHFSSMTFPYLNIKEEHAEHEPGGEKLLSEGHDSSQFSVQTIEKPKSVQESSNMLEFIECTSLSERHGMNKLWLQGAKKDFVDRIPHTIHRPQMQRERTDSNIRLPGEFEETKQEDEKQKMVVAPTLADSSISTDELKRLHTLSVHVKDKIKIDNSSKTAACALSIIEKFRTCEMVKIKFKGSAASSTKIIIADLEKKTGGLAIWKAGSELLLYRGRNCSQPMLEIAGNVHQKKLGNVILEDERKLQVITPNDGKSEVQGTGSEAWQEGVLNQEHKPLQKKKKSRFGPKDHEEYDAAMEDILSEIGPRYVEWIGPHPVPVDVDLLPQVSHFSPPFRFLPYGISPSLSISEATRLCRLSCPLLPHFVIGRSTPLESLAAAMVQLWEKSEIAKVGVKRDVLNSNQERIAAEIKRLTGGTLLCRDKHYITFHRGQDFLPKGVAAALIERANMDHALEEEEERWRGDQNIATHQSQEASSVQPSWVHRLDVAEQNRLKKEAEKARWVQKTRMAEQKLAKAISKRERVERKLNKIEKLIKPGGQAAELGTLTDEELLMFRKLGFRMKAYLPVGRRGAFSGIVQNMHLHWKHRELVKLLIKERDQLQLEETVKMLVYESGGILVGAEPTSKGQAVLVYRGKNYKAPGELRPTNLLTKRVAFQRSVEIQRHDTLTMNIENLERELAYLRAGLKKFDEACNFTKLNQTKDDKHDDGGGGSATNIESEAVRKLPHLDKKRSQRLCEENPVFKSDPATKLEAEQHDVLELEEGFLVDLSDSCEEDNASGAGSKSRDSPYIYGADNGEETDNDANNTFIRGAFTGESDVSDNGDLLDDESEIEG